MIEHAMIFALGFLLAGLLALVIAPAFWRRALRLSTRRLEMLIPLSSREIIAERDLLRAEFAVDRRKFEREAEGLRAIRFADLAELGRRAAELVAKDGTYAALEARHAAQAAELAASRRAHSDSLAQLAAASSALYSDAGLIERKDADLLQLRGDLARSRAEARTQSAALADFEAQLAIERANLATARDDIARLRDGLGSLRIEREVEQARAETLAQELAALRRQNGARDSARLTTDREENGILRQKINEIGAAIVRTAGLALEPAAGPQPPDRIDDSREQAAAGGLAEPNVAAAAKQRQMAKRL